MRAPFNRAMECRTGEPPRITRAVPPCPDKKPKPKPDDITAGDVKPAREQQPDGRR